ncbi:MAG TPA: hypothetical protein PLA74_11485 [Syntrophales bacterium]|nr:hypothetical protein [Syntrophales bacterium]
MRAEESWDYYSYNTDVTSRVSRQLAFAAAGICWFFKSPDILFPDHIYFALVSIVFYFIFDVSQYLVTAITYRIWIIKCKKEFRERGMDFEDNEVDAEEDWWLNFPSRLALLSKVAFLFISYGFIGAEILSRL